MKNLLIAVAISAALISGTTAKETWNVIGDSQCWFPKTSNYDDGEVTVQSGHGLTLICKIKRPFCLPPECTTYGHSDLE
jgi:hypothetical protein